MDAVSTLLLRQRAGELLATGASPSAVAWQLPCSRVTVYRARQLVSAGNLSVDGRRNNPGRPRLFGELIEQAVLKARGAVMPIGPRMRYHRMVRDPARYGPRPEEVPSPTTIARMVREAGLATTAVGPRDERLFPDAHPTAPG